MPQSSATGQRAACAAADSGPAIGSIPPAQRRPLSTADRLERLSMKLDDLIRDIRFTPQPRSHGEVDRRIAEAEDIAGELRAIFRAPARAERPPLWQSAEGTRAVW
jgi:hypothetical protein